MRQTGNLQCVRRTLSRRLQSAGIHSVVTGAAAAVFCIRLRGFSGSRGVGGSELLEFAGLDEIDPLGDVDDVIADALQIFGGEQHVEGEEAARWLRRDDLRQVVAYLMIERVYGIVVPNDFIHQIQIVMHEGLQGVVEHGAGQLRQTGQVYQRAIDLVGAGQPPPDLGDVYRIVGDSLDVRDELERRADDAQVAGNG